MYSVTVGLRLMTIYSSSFYAGVCPTHVFRIKDPDWIHYRRLRHL